MLRGRAALLVSDRTDIADAAEADGVILSATGEPPYLRLTHPFAHRITSATFFIILSEEILKVR
jgi:thiamine monophosphate synthase